MSVAKAFDMALRLIQDGYAPYKGEVDQSVYDEQKCRSEKNAKWFIRITPKRRVQICVGCKRECILVNSPGFQAVLPVEAKFISRIVVGTLPILSDEELLATKKTITIPEAEVVCRVSERKIRSLIDDGTLIATEDGPIRIHSSSVIEYLDTTR